MEKKLKSKKNKYIAKIERLNTKIDELENNWKRALADYKNLQKRSEEERFEVVKFANGTLVQRLLFVLDNLELMAQHTDDQGVNLITKELKQILTDEGLQEIEISEGVFDATTMEAVELIEGDKNKVIEITQKGYFFKNKVLRPTKVKVGKG